MDEDKETFQKTVFDELAKEFNLTLQEKRQEKPNLTIAYTNELVERPVAKTYGAFSAVVLKNQELQSEKVPAKQGISNFNYLKASTIKKEIISESCQK